MPEILKELPRGSLISGWDGRYFSSPPPPFPEIPLYQRRYSNWRKCTRRVDPDALIWNWNRYYVSAVSLCCFRSRSDVFISLVADGIGKQKAREIRAGTAERAKFPRRFKDGENILRENYNDISRSFGGPHIPWWLQNYCIFAWKYCVYMFDFLLSWNYPDYLGFFFLIIYQING